MKSGVKNIQAAAYNVACTVCEITKLATQSLEFRSENQLILLDSKFKKKRSYIKVHITTTHSLG